MKKLEKLKLHNLEEICANEQKAMKGGGVWVPSPDGNSYYSPGEVVVSLTGNNYILVAYNADNGQSKSHQVTWDEWAAIAEGSYTAARYGAAFGIQGASVAYVGTTIALWLSAYFNGY